MTTPAPSTLVALLRGEKTWEEVSATTGLSVTELRRLTHAYLDGLEAGERRAHAWRRQALRVVAVLVVFGVGLTAREALSGTCTHASSAIFNALGLSWFCADEPAMASEVNANTLQLVRLMEAKVGGLGPADGGNGNVTASSLSVSRLSAGYYTPPYASWTGTGADVGNGGAAIVNDNSGYRALMLVGNTADGGSRRQVKAFDDLTVVGRLTVTDKQCHVVANSCQVSGSLEYLDRQAMICPTDEVLQGLQTFNFGGGTVRIAITCCKY
jgi:hypothetical protein